MEEMLSNLTPELQNQFLLGYVDLLDKTNQQMTLFGNPYMFGVVILGVLFTALTIIAAILIWRQSKEYKQMVVESITKFQDALNEQVKKIKKEAKVSINTVISKHEKNFESLPSELKEEANKIINDLKNERDLMDSRIPVHSLDSFIYNPRQNSDLNVSLDEHLNNNSASEVMDEILGGHTCKKCLYRTSKKAKYCRNCGNNNY